MEPRHNRKTIEKSINEPGALYRFFDAEGILLYVGITNSPSRRFSEHCHKPWWGEVEDIEVDWFTCRWEAEDAEQCAIWQEHPRYNRANPIPDEHAHLAARGPRACEVVVIGDAIDQLLGAY